jgi:hypothetical protein
MHVEKGKYYRDGNGRVIGPLMFTGDGEFLHLVAEVYVSDTPPAAEVETLRDKFAGLALLGFMARPDMDIELGDPKAYSAWAYKYADAMMEARKK